MDTPPAPAPHKLKPSAKGMGQAIKDPKVLVAVAVVGVLMALYFRSRQNANANLPATDGSSTPVGDYNYYPDQTEGAGAGTGAYGGYDSPTMNQPDWLIDPPAWVLNAPAWWGTEPPTTNSSNPAANPGIITLQPGQTIYDPEHGMVTAPAAAAAAAQQTTAGGGVAVTGGGPPTPVSHATPAPKPVPAPASTYVAGPARTRDGTPAPKPDPRYVVRKRPQPGGKKDHIWHDYESAYGKGDYGAGRKVDMGTA